MRFSTGPGGRTTEGDTPTGAEVMQAFDLNELIARVTRLMAGRRASRASQPSASARANPSCASVERAPGIPSASVGNGRPQLCSPWSTDHWDAEHLDPQERPSAAARPRPSQNRRRRLSRRSRTWFTRGEASRRSATSGCAIARWRSPEALAREMRRLKAAATGMPVCTIRGGAVAQRSDTRSAARAYAGMAHRFRCRVGIARRSVHAAQPRGGVPSTSCREARPRPSGP